MFFDEEYTTDEFAGGTIDENKFHEEGFNACCDKIKPSCKKCCRPCCKPCCKPCVPVKKPSCTKCTTHYTKTTICCPKYKTFYTKSKPHCEKFTPGC